MSAVTRRLMLGAAALGALACGDIASPERTDLYEWRLFVPGTGGGTDTLSFFWNQSHLPVRIWAEDAAGLPGYAERAIGVWESGFLYREFRADFTTPEQTGDRPAGIEAGRNGRPPRRQPFFFRSGSGGRPRAASTCSAA